MASRAKIVAAESELGRIAREVEKLMDLYLRGRLTPTMTAFGLQHSLTSPRFSSRRFVTT